MPKKCVIINRKGGCGKTTLSTNLAGYYASKGDLPALFDYDPQDSAIRWVRMRPKDANPIHGVAAAHPPEPGTTRSFQLRVPPETRHIIVDTPASLKKMELSDILRGATAVLVPVLPSAIDLHVTEAFVDDLRGMLGLYAPTAALALVANRVKRNTLSSHGLGKFLAERGLTPVASLRDAQNYVKAAQNGTCIHEMKRKLTQQDRDEWRPLIHWLRKLAPEAAGGSVHFKN